MRTLVTKKKLIIAATALLLIAGGYAIYRNNTKDKVTVTPSGAKLAPATEEEKQQAADHKTEIIEDQQDTDQTPTSGKKTVAVTITDASSSVVKAYVTGVFEDGGSCSAVFTQGATVVTRTSAGFTNVSYTQCAPIKPDLPSGGSWSVVVKYSSAAAEGTSQSRTF